MPDIAHWYGSDLSVGASGDILLTDGDTLVQQRIVRRLLTNTGDYIWQLEYGAGLGLLPGKVNRAGAIQTLVRSQIFQESSVAQIPAPTITATADQNGSVVVVIQYTDANTGTSKTLSFSI